MVDSDILDDKNPGVLWEYLSVYHSKWHVDDFPGNYYYNYTKRCSEDITEFPDGVVSMKYK